MLYIALFSLLYLCFLLLTNGQIRNDVSTTMASSISTTSAATRERENNGILNVTEIIQGTDKDGLAISRTLCDFCLYDGEGNFSSFDYPAPYRADLDCTYRVKRVDDSCHLEVSFHEFDIQGITEEPCLTDYLLINGRRFCGHAWKGKTELVYFPPELDEFTFRFHTDADISGGGFWMEIKKQPGTCILAAQESCNKGFDSEEFSFHSPKFPEGYDNNQECFFHVTKYSQDVCGLELTFLTFDIEPSDNCAYDYLEVSGKRLCGTISPNAVRVFMFSENEILMQFSSDDQNNRSGFNIKARQINKCYPEQLESSTSSLPPAPPSCNICSESKSGEIVSWGYPHGYANNLTCQYTITRIDNRYCFVELEFVDFDVDFTIGCTGDYLQIEGKRNCGTSLRGQKKTVQFDSVGSVIILFQTDSISVKKGFKASFQQISCSVRAPHLPTALPPSCDAVFEQEEFYLRSPNYPLNYSNNLDCRYVIRRQGNKICALELTFNYFDIESSVGCRKDFFEINGVRYCDKLGENVVRTFKFQTADKVIAFHSDSTNSRSGFFIRIVQQECDPRSAATSNDECGQEIRNMDFEIKSPNYPEKYSNDLSCQYIVHRYSRSICEVAINIQDFELQEGEVCENDYLQIGEVRLCGSIESGTIRTYSFGNQDKITVNLETDGSIAKRGFLLSGKQRDCSVTNQPPWSTSTLWPTKPVWAATQSPNCDQTITNAEDILYSPQYPDNYPDSVDCQYVISRMSDRLCELEITINNLHIQVGDSCQYDFLEVDGHRFCGSTSAGNKRIFNFKSDRIVINFHSDSSINDRGFEVMLKQRECSKPSTTEKPDSKSCDDVFDSREFLLTSPNYPDDYDSNLDCKYIIRRSEDNVCKVEMLFVAFDVESSSECEYDYLSINGEKLCGVMKNITRTYLFQDYEKVLTFHSDSGTSRPGFMIQVRQLDCFTQTTELPPLPLKPCDQEFSSSSFEIRSDNHPSHYDPNLNCIYTITRSHRNICDLDLVFLTFDVEASEGCQYDYLEIDGEKLCGVYPANLKRSIKFVGPELIFKFHSDGATSRPGFHLRVQQVDCISRTLSTVAPSKATTSVPTSCDYRYENISGVFHSPSFPYVYPENVQCIYTFVGYPGHCRVLLNFLEFSLQTDSAACEEDYIEINRIKYCGPQLLGQTRTITFYGSPREISVTFRSDGKISDKGFYAVFRQLPCTSSAPSHTTRPTKRPTQGLYVASCDRLYASLKFDIISPEYPKNYPDERNCRYTIRRLSDRICQLRFIFKVFDVESSDNCEYDYLEIHGKKLCGTLLENTIREYDIRDYQEIIKFHSDAANSRSGFLIKVEQIECSGSQQPHLFQPEKDSHPIITDDHPLLGDDHFVYPPHLPVEDYEHLFDHSYQPHYPHLHRKIPAVDSSNGYEYRNCDKTFLKEEFEIRSVNFPGNYPNSLNCRYIIKKASSDICWLKLTFIRFEIESSVDCQYDYLNINSKRICGTLPDDEIRAYIFSSDELSLYFRSDGATSSRGFMIRGEQLRCQASSTTTTTTTTEYPEISPCDRTFDREIFVIQSPNFPDDYPDSANCQYSIRKFSRYICDMEITLLSFDIENERNCDNDYLLIGNEKLCGPMPSKTTRRVPFPTQEVTISFYSNGVVTRPGFSILVKQNEDCEDQGRSLLPSSCDQSLVMERSIIQSPGFPDDYPVNITCHYTVHKVRSAVCGLNLQILSFDVEDKADDKCNNDYLDLGDGNKICGHLPKEHSQILKFKNGVLKLTFFSDGTTRRPGFSILANQVTECGDAREQASTTPFFSPATQEVTHPPQRPSSCDKIFTSQEFIIESPDFPSNYPNDVTCKYIVRRSSNNICGLEMIFLHFDIEDGPDCNYDYFDIGYKTICGQLPSGFSRTIPFDTPEKIFVFNSDKGTSWRGFSIKARQLSDCASTWRPATPPAEMCDYCLKENRGHLTSPNYPQEYKNDLQCSYHIERVKGFCGLEIYFHDFNLEASRNCSKDSLSIEEKQYCGTDLKRKIKKLHFPFGNPNEIQLNLRTDSNDVASGFHAEYRQLPCRGYPWRQDRGQESLQFPSEWIRNATTSAHTSATESRSDLRPLFMADDESLPSYLSSKVKTHQNITSKQIWV